MILNSGGNGFAPRRKKDKHAVAHEIYNTGENCYSYEEDGGSF